MNTNNMLIMKLHKNYRAIFKSQYGEKMCSITLDIEKTHAYISSVKPIKTSLGNSVQGYRFNDSYPYPYPYLFLLKVICIFVLVFFMGNFSNWTHVRKCKEYFLKRRINPYRKLLVQELKLFGAAQILYGIFPA